MPPDATKSVIMLAQSKSVLEARPGTYFLLLSSTTDVRIRVGRLGTMRLQPGFYVYVGSAFGPGGVRARVSHHQHISPRPHWHIDYLRAHTVVEEVWVCYSHKRLEHLWARFLSSMKGVSVPVPGFGSSDCGCEAHLFSFKSHAMREQIFDVLNVLQLILVHPKVMSQFVDDRAADLLPDFGLVGADRFNIPLI